MLIDLNEWFLVLVMLSIKFVNNVLHFFAFCVLGSRNKKSEAECSSSKRSSSNRRREKCGARTGAAGSGLTSQCSMDSYQQMSNEDKSGT